MWPIISIVIAAILLVFLVVLFVIRRNNKRPPDYYNLFVAGIVWFALGLPLAADGSYLFLVMGIVMSAIGLTHKSKWKENRQTWSALGSREKIFKTALIIVLGILVASGLTLYILSSI